MLVAKSSSRSSKSSWDSAAHSQPWSSEWTCIEASPWGVCKIRVPELSQAFISSVSVEFALGLLAGDSAL